MAFLTLNGIEVPIAADSAERAAAFIGDVGSRARGGMLGRALRAEKREWSFTTTPLPVSEVDAWEGLIEGRGHHWSFNADAKSTRGRDRAPSSVGLFNAGRTPGGLTAAHGLYGSACDVLANVYTDLTDYFLGLTNSWTIIASAWRGAGAWDFFIESVTSGVGTTRWRNGSTTIPSGFGLESAAYNPANGILSLNSPARWGGAIRTNGQAVALNGKTAVGSYAYNADVGGTTHATTPPTFPTVPGQTVLDGTVTWRNIGRWEAFFGDLAWLPYRVPASWGSQIHAFHSANAWSDLPRVVAGGTFAPAAVTVRGEVTDAESVQYSLGGVWTTCERLTFMLREV